MQDGFIEVRGVDVQQGLDPNTLGGPASLTVIAGADDIGVPLDNSLHPALQCRCRSVGVRWRCRRRRPNSATWQRCAPTRRPRPLVWALSTSLKPKSEIFATPPTLIPHAATTENYKALLTGRPQYFQSGGQQVTSGTTPAQFFTRWFFNSVIVTLGSTLISITVSTLAAYSLTRFRYWGRHDRCPTSALLGYMVPSIIFVFPLFLVMVAAPTLRIRWAQPRAGLCVHHAALLSCG